MPKLIVAGFQGTRRAAQVLAHVVDRNAQLAIQLKDAVAVYRTGSGTLRFDSNVQPTRADGALLGGAMRAFGGDDATADREQYSISEAQVRKMGSIIQPGESALFALADPDHPQWVAEDLRGYGATIVTATVPAWEAGAIARLADVGVHAH